MDKNDVLAIHEKMLAAHGGARGTRDDGLLESAIARPRQHYAYAGHPDIIEMAALYTASIVRKPFVDGNKRTGFMAGALFVEINGYEFKASPPLAAQAVLELAAGSIDEEGFTLFLRDHSKRARRKR